MNWPTTPPAMPAPGWYPDPEYPSTWRWWDGVQWADVRQAMPQAPPRDPFSFSAWFEAATAVVKAVIRRVGLVVVAVFVACFGLLAIVVRQAVVSDDAQELFDLIEFESGYTSNGSTLELTTAERDRVLELLGDLAWTWLPWLLALGILTWIVMTWALALAARSAGDEVAAVRAESPADGELGAVSVAALRRVPAVIGGAVVVGLIAIAAMALVLAPMFLAIAVEGGAAMIALTATFGGIAAFVLVAWLVGRLTLVMTIAALGGHGVGVRRSWELTRGHYWGVVGRYLVASLIASVASAPINLIGNVAFAFPLSVSVFVMLVLQAVATAASVLITMPASVVIVDHLERQPASAMPAAG